ncbi:MAG: phosphoribosylformylglycinamidine synthase subunit PurS [Deltaproteobacteria bacterium]|jgi:phosphoribosylformylglycinamidine synthase PurS subunit|nr:MAG: phosphoribosylformylglycinamidine synthase subunit PurS [Deltaproteobacteria bacterium]
MKELKAKVEIKLKPGVLDPQGKAILSALHNLGYGEIEEARVGKLIELKLKDTSKEEATKRIEDMCKKLLANPVIEDFIIRFEE